MTEAYALHWPQGWPRTLEHKRQSGKFREINEAYKEALEKVSI